MKLKLIALAALLASAGGAHAAIANSSANGNTSSGDMFTNIVSAANSASFAADLGIRLDQFLTAVAPNALGINLVWDLDNSTFNDLSTVATGLQGLVQTINYGNVFTTFGTPTVLGASDLKFDVKAMDGLPTALAGAGTNRYLSTSGAASVTATNGNVFGLDAAVDPYLNFVNNDTTNSTHTASLTQAGASMFDAGDANGVNHDQSVGDNWVATTNFSSMGSISSPLNFFSLSNSSSSAAAQAAVVKYSGVWAFNANTAQLSYVTAPVPEADTYAMLLAGLGLMGAMVRRRKSV